VTAFTVRGALPDELDAAGRIVVEAYRAHGGPSADEDEYLGEVLDARGRARLCPVLVAVDEATGEVLGSVSYVPGRDNPLAEIEREGEAGFRMLGVAPTAQRRGIGEALVRACIERARADGRQGVAICTELDMHAARRLYERLGFRRAPDRDFDPVPGVHLIGYLLALPAQSVTPR
jgi:ribosomal protein S18 acetylase RimI-like enzyme